MSVDYSPPDPLSDPDPDLPRDPDGTEVYPPEPEDGSPDPEEAE